MGCRRLFLFLLVGTFAFAPATFAFVRYQNRPWIFHRLRLCPGHLMLTLSKCTDIRRRTHVICCSSQEQRKTVSDLSCEELFSWINDDLKLKTAAKCLREQAPSLSWSTLTTMMEEPKIVDRLERMGISYLDAIALKGEIRRNLRRKPVGPKEPG